MAKAIDDETYVVWIANPNNPTGTLAKGEQVEAFLRKVPERVLVVLDEAYNEYLAPELRADSVKWLKRHPNLVITRTFSKAYGLAGLRVGYAVGPRKCIAAMAKVRRPFDLTTPAQVAAVASIGDDAELARRRSVNDEGLARLESLLREHALEPVPSVGNFVYVDTGADGTELFERLLREGVIVRPLAGFGSPNAIRVSVGTPGELDVFAGALGRVLQGAGLT